MSTPKLNKTMKKINNLGLTISGWELHQAIIENNLERIKGWMLKQTIDPNTHFRGETLLATCVHHNRHEILEFLLEIGANPDMRSDEGGRKETPLITAVRLKNSSLAKLLISHRAQVSATNFYGQDAIYQAVVDNAFEILEYLLCSCSYSYSYSCAALELNENSYQHQQVFLQCPLYLALTQSFIYPSKKTSLLHLLRFNYNCPCLLQLFSRITSSVTSTDQDQDQDQDQTARLSEDADRSRAIRNRNRERTERRPRTCNQSNHDNDSNILSMSRQRIKVDLEIIHWIYLSFGYPVIKFPSHLSSPPHQKQWQIYHVTKTNTKTTHTNISMTDREQRREVLSLSWDSTDSHSSFSLAFGARSRSQCREELYPTKLIYLSRITIRKLSTISAGRRQTSFVNIIKALPLPPPLINFLLLGEIRP